MTDITDRLLCMGYEEAVCDPAVMEEAAYEIVQLRAERDRMKDALLQIASSGVDGESLNLSGVGHAGCINVAKDALKENDQ